MANDPKAPERIWATVRAAAALNCDMRTARAIAATVLRAAFGGSDGEGGER